jgi:hypothetical protein
MVLMLGFRMQEPQQEPLVEIFLARIQTLNLLLPVFLPVRLEPGALFQLLRLTQKDASPMSLRLLFRFLRLQPRLLCRMALLLLATRLRMLVQIISIKLLPPR